MIRSNHFSVVDDTPIGEAIGQLDYPLIDIPFNDGNEYVIVICNGIYNEEQTYLWCPDGKELQFNKEHIFVRTYPAGRGTTGNGVLTEHKGTLLKKEIILFECVTEPLQNGSRLRWIRWKGEGRKQRIIKYV